MKLFKKTAALLFCLALVFSVMAISASATGDNFTLTLTKSSTSSDKLDRDNDGVLELNQGESVTYDIFLGGGPANAKVNALQFNVTLPTGVTVTRVTINNKNCETSFTNLYAYSAEGDSQYDLESSDSTAIGTITFKFGKASGDEDSVTAVAENVELNPQLTSIKAERVGVDTADDIASFTTVKAIVNPKYTITLKSATFDQTTGVQKATTNWDSGTLDYYFSTGATLPSTPADVGGYDYQGWVTTTSGTSGWDSYAPDSAPVANGSTIPAGKVGAATMSTKYNIVTYTATFVYNGGQINENTTRTKTYTIADLADETVDFLGLVNASETVNVPTRTAYEFKGWLPSHTADDTRSDYPTTKWPATTPVTAASIVGAYGNVTLTADWDEIGYFAKLDYDFAGSNNSLILFCVPSGQNDSYNSAYTYKCDSNAMFKITNTAKVNKYVTEAQNPTKQGATAQLTDLPTTYVMYAYIAVSTTEKSDITIDEASATGNTAIAYNGDVYQNNVIDVSDFGNVDSLTRNQDAFEISSSTNVRQRLEADMAESNGATTETNFVSILDIKAIYELVGTTIS